MGATCRSCSAPIIWAEHHGTGRRMPLDADGRWRRPTGGPAASAAVVSGGGEVRDVPALLSERGPSAVAMSEHLTDEEKQLRREQIRSASSTRRNRHRPTGTTSRPSTTTGSTGPRRSSCSNRELRKLNATGLVLEIDVRERDLRISDGMPRADARPASPAVAVSFQSKHGPLRYATDVFTDWQDNLRAIALGLEALRKVDRYGIATSGEQYTGWKALPSAPSGETPRQVLQRHAQAGGYGDGEDADLRDLYRLAARATHPDRGGARSAFDEVQAARAALEAGGQW